MLTGVTGSGFNYEIADERINNMELVDALAEFDAVEDDGEMTLIMSRVCTLLLGSKQKAKLYDHLRASAGNVPIDKVINEVKEIISSGQTKN